MLVLDFVQGLLLCQFVCDGQINDCLQRNISLSSSNFFYSSVKVGDLPLLEQAFVYKGKIRSGVLLVVVGQLRCRLILKKDSMLFFIQDDQASLMDVKNLMTRHALFYVDHAHLSDHQVDCDHVQTLANNCSCVIHIQIFIRILEKILSFEKDRNCYNDRSDKSWDELKVILDDIEQNAH